MRNFFDSEIGLFLVATIPAVILLIQVWRADRKEKEPLKLLVSLVLWGILATVFALFSEQYLEGCLDQSSLSGQAYDFVLYFIVVGLSEEFFKYVLLRWRTWHHPSFNYLFDGIVYAVFVSLGFALWENIAYTFNYGFDVAVLRAITAVPGHACFGVFMGLWYGEAKRAQKKGNKGFSTLCSVLALLFPVLLHGAYDYVASMPQDNSLLFIILVGVMFIGSYLAVDHASRTDTQI